MAYFEEGPTIELYHHGVKGQHWGIRRYQNEDGTLTEEGRKHWKELNSSEKTEIKKEMVDKAALKDIRTFKNDFTTAEIRTALQNFDERKKLENIKDENYEKGKKACEKLIKKVDSYGNTMGTLSKAVTNTTNLYNGVAKAMNAFTDTNLPVIEGGKKKKGKGDD